LSREIRAPDLTSRLKTLIHDSDIFYAIESGGPGTLNEVFLVWAMSVLGEISGKPLVLLGEGWSELLSLLCQKFSVPEETMADIAVAADVQAALDYARRLIRSGPVPP
jgi:predicted Rossmann-fold nucleotide-binding protein